MKITLSVFGFEVFSIEVERPEPTFIFEEDEEEPESTVLCWQGEEFAEFIAHPGGEGRTIFGDVIDPFSPYNE